MVASVRAARTESQFLSTAGVRCRRGPLLLRQSQHDFRCKQLTSHVLMRIPEKIIPRCTPQRREGSGGLPSSPRRRRDRAATLGRATCRVVGSPCWRLGRAVVVGRDRERLATADLCSTAGYPGLPQSDGSSQAVAAQLRHPTATVKKGIASLPKAAAMLACQIPCSLPTDTALTLPSLPVADTGPGPFH